MASSSSWKPNVSEFTSARRSRIFRPAWTPSATPSSFTPGLKMNFSIVNVKTSNSSSASTVLPTVNVESPNVKVSSTVADSSNPPSQYPTLTRSMMIRGRLSHALRSWKSSGLKSKSDATSTSDPVNADPSARMSPLSVTSHARSRTPKISSPSCRASARRIAII